MVQKCLEQFKQIYLKNLVVICLSVAFFGCSPLPNQASELRQVLLTNSNTSLTSPTIVTSSKQAEDLVSLSAGLIPSAITLEEVRLREQQVQIAKELEQYVKSTNRGGVASSGDVFRVTYFRLDSEIKLLQARQLLKAAAHSKVK